MQNVFETKGKPSVLELTCKSNTFAPCSFDVIVYDKQRLKSYYSRQNYLVSQAQKLTINLPVTPNKIGVQVEPVNFDLQLFEIKPEIKPLATLSKGLSPEVYGFMKWAKWFCINASILPDKIYYQQPKGKYYINYMPVIVDDQFGEQITPARIHNKTNEIQVAADYFMPLSIPSRMVVMAHEISHNIWKNDEEFVPDQSACEICKMLGYTPEQIWDGFEEFMIDTPLNRERKKLIYNTLFINGKT